MPARDKGFDHRLAGIFRQEAAQHVQTLLDGLVELDSAGADARPAVARVCFRAAHSLKGAARAVGKADVEAVCHLLETLFLALEQGALAAEPQLLDLLHRVVRELKQAGASTGPGARVELLALLEPLEQAAAGVAAADPLPLPPAEAEAPQLADAGEETVRISVNRLSRLLYQVEELVSAKAAALDQAHRSEEVYAQCLPLLRGARGTAGAAEEAVRRQAGARLKALMDGAKQDCRALTATVDALLDDVKQTLLLPFSTLSSLLAATVRELSRSQGKQVELVIAGGEVEMDRRLLDALGEPLLHLLRNAVDHGLERPDDRAAVGKSAQGVLMVSVARAQGGVVTVSVRDDGAGVDLQRLADAGRRAGAVLEADAPAADILSLAFAPGVTTATMLTEVSGRGEGLAIVQDKVERLGGTVGVRSEPGAGTCFTMSLPVSLATLRAVQVRAGGMSFFLPVAHVERCGRLPADGPATLAGRETVTVGDAPLPLVSLAAVLELPAGAAAVTSYAVLRAGERRIAFAVDEVLGEQEVLSKPLEARLSRSHVVAGAASSSSGAAVVILNPASLVRRALNGGLSRFTAPAPQRQRQLSILLAEDSITSRTLLKNILELAGHRVVLAVDGAQALARLRNESFDVVVSDIEMPNLDGFGLTAAIRQDPRLSELPVILVTSLSSPGDRERGAEVGANAYLVKSSFEQGDLLQAIRELA